VTDGHAEHGDDEHQLPVEPGDDDEGDDGRYKKRDRDNDGSHVGIDRTGRHLQSSICQHILELSDKTVN